jgi:hypothetical protein
MARKEPEANGHDRLADALATLIQNQAAFVGQLAETERHHLEFERRHLEFERRHQQFEQETAERFARIETQMAQIIQVLAEHGRILERLPDAVRDKIGFKA